VGIASQPEFQLGRPKINYEDLQLRPPIVRLSIDEETQSEIADLALRPVHRLRPCTELLVWANGLATFERRGRGALSAISRSGAFHQPPIVEHNGEISGSIAVEVKSVSPLVIDTDIHLLINDFRVGRGSCGEHAHDYRDCNNDGVRAQLDGVNTPHDVPP